MVEGSRFESRKILSSRCCSFLDDNEQNILGKLFHVVKDVRFEDKRRKMQVCYLKFEDGANKEMKVPIFIGSGKSKKLGSS